MNQAFCTIQYDQDFDHVVFPNKEDRCASILIAEVLEVFSTNPAAAKCHIKLFTKFCTFPHYSSARWGDFIRKTQIQQMKHVIPKIHPTQWSFKSPLEPCSSSAAQSPAFAQNHISSQKMFFPPYA